MIDYLIYFTINITKKIIVSNIKTVDTLYVPTVQNNYNIYFMTVNLNNLT